MILIIIDFNNLEHDTFIKYSFPLIKKECLIIGLDELLYSTKIHLSITNDYDCFTLILKDGRTLHSSEIEYCLNLVSYIYPTYLNKFLYKDREYVVQEWNSILLTILFLLKDKMLFNEPKPLNLTGDVLGLEEFILKANQFNLPVKPYFASNKGDFGFLSGESKAISIPLIIYDGHFFSDKRLISLIPEQNKVNLQNLCIHNNFKYIELQMEISKNGIYFKSANTSFTLLNQTPDFFKYLLHKINL